MSLSEQELYAAFAEAKADAGLPAMKRVRIELEDGYMSASVAVDADMEQVEAEMRRSLQAVRDFNALPEVDRLKYYLANAYKSLKAISDATFNEVGKIDYGCEQQKRMSEMIANAACTADMACCMIPTEYKTTDIKIGA